MLDIKIEQFFSLVLIHEERITGLRVYVTKSGCEQVAVPLLMAQVLTYPEKVSRYNIEKLRGRIINGMTKHPGANFILYPDGHKA